MEIKKRDDHVKMFRNGKPKLIPMTVIETWIRGGQLADSGWTFAPGAKAIYDEWFAEETRRRQRVRSRPKVIHRDPGFADISQAVGMAAEAEASTGPIEPPAPSFSPPEKEVVTPPEATLAAEMIEILEE